jgi:hypothetical protein
MSDTALVIKWDVSGSQFSESFADYELLQAPLSTDDDDVMKELQDNAPVRISRTTYRKLVINFILHSTNQQAISTLSKLKNIDSIGDTLYVYYKYIADPTVYKKCVLPKGQVPDEWIVAGMDSGRNELQVEFLEVA